MGTGCPRSRFVSPLSVPHDASGSRSNDWFQVVSFQGPSACSRNTNPSDTGLALESQHSVGQ